MCAAAGNADAQLMGNGHLQNSVWESVPFDGAHTWVNGNGGAGVAFSPERDSEGHPVDLHGAMMDDKFSPKKSNFWLDGCTRASRIVKPHSGVSSVATLVPQHFLFKPVHPQTQIISPNSGGSRISQTGGHQPLDFGQKTITWQDICRKLHENERI